MGKGGPPAQQKPEEKSDSSHGSRQPNLSVEIFADRGAHGPKMDASLSACVARSLAMAATI